MTPRTKEQFDGIRREKRLLIMNTAMRLFVQFGYEGTSISKIAEEASISKGLLYNYFDSKEVLLKSIFTEGISNLSYVLFDISNEDNNPELLISLTENYLEILSDNSEFWKLFYSLMALPWTLKLFDKEYKHFYTRYLTYLTEIFSSKGHKNPYKSARFFAGALDGLVIYYLYFPGFYTKDEILDFIKEKFN